MNDQERYKKPEPTAGDTAHTLTRAGLSAIPIVGGPAAELFSMILFPPLTRRRDEWVQSIADGLTELEEKVEGFKIEDLSDNEAFVTTLMQASQVAIRNHQKEKLESLRSAVLNAALPSSPEEDLQALFLELVDTLTAWHLRVLKLLDDPIGYGEKHGITYRNVSMGSLSHLIGEVYPELREHEDFCSQLVEDLHTRGMLSTDSVHTMMTGAGIYASRTTVLGKQFLAFVTSPLEADHGRTHPS